ncbi:MAG TPA: PRC-barrel domain-containing protein [Solirubrobacterales bacterium]
MSEAATALALPEVLDWVGAEVAECEGATIGLVHGFYVDVAGGHPVWMVTKLGKRRGARVVALPIGTCAGSASGVWTAFEAELVRHAPVVDPRRPLRREHELAVCAHFGIGEAVGRAAEVASRPEGEITAEPARG